MVKLPKHELGTSWKLALRRAIFSGNNVDAMHGLLEAALYSIGQIAR